MTLYSKSIKILFHPTNSGIIAFMKVAMEIDVLLIVKPYKEGILVRNVSLTK